jgi:hypothetical protein
MILTHQIKLKGYKDSVFKSLRVSILFGYFLLLIVSCNSNYYEKDDAIRSLKVLNSDIINLMTVTSELEEIKVLEFLYNQANAPIPFKKSKYSKDTPDFRFSDFKGTYKWNYAIEDFELIGDNDFIDIQFNLEDIDSDSFQLLSYQSEPYSSKPDFPTHIIAKIFNGTKEKMTVNHYARVEDNLPATMKTSVKGDNFDLVAGFKRTKELNEGTLTMYCIIKKGLYTIIDVNISAEISYSKQGYYYNNIAFKSNVFNHTIVGEIDYKNIDPSSRNYPKSFNSNSTIAIYESSNNKVGDVVLAPIGNNDLQEFKIRFKNKDQVLLKEYLPALDRLYNLKY